MKGDANMKVPREAWERAKAYAEKHGRKIRDVMAEAIEKLVQDKPASDGRGRMKDWRKGTPPGPKTDGRGLMANGQPVDPDAPTKTSLFPEPLSR